MQSENQVVILGISTFLKNRKRLTSCHLDFKLYSLLLQCSGHVQSKNRVDLVEVSIFCKSEKKSGQTIWPIEKIKQ